MAGDGCFRPRWVSLCVSMASSCHKLFPDSPHRVRLGLPLPYPLFSLRGALQGITGPLFLEAVTADVR